MADGARTHDNWNHNPGLYQLSYSHHRDLNLACPTGIEPVTPSLEGWCSIRLSYGQIVGQSKLLGRNWSGWRDLNSRHPAPKAGALPGYATPRGPRLWRNLI